MCIHIPVKFIFVETKGQWLQRVQVNFDARYGNVHRVLREEAMLLLRQLRASDSAAFQKAAKMVRNQAGLFLSGEPPPKMNLFVRGTSPPLFNQKRGLFRKSTDCWAVFSWSPSEYLFFVVSR